MDTLIKADAIKKEIEDEVEVQMIWSPEDINQEDPLADVKAEEIEGAEDIPKQLIPNLVPKVEAELIQSSTLLHDCPIKSEPNLLEDDGVVHELVPKVKTETQSSAMTRELRICLKRLSVADLVVKVKSSCGVEPLMETDNKGSEVVQGSDPLNGPLKVCESGTTQVGRHRKSKMSADSNNSSSTTDVLTKTTYTCEMCNICFKSQVRYKKHLLNHSESELLSCAHCSYKTLYKDKLISHMNKHLGVKKQYRCKYCSYKCYRSCYLKAHIGEKPYVCKVCPQKFSQSSSLKRHMRTHTGEKPFACKVCSYKCSNSTSFKIHMRTHTGEKPYVCKVCPYKCSELGLLKRHMTCIHSVEKPFSCKICSYKCLQSSTLKIHMRTHTGEKPYVCNVCSHKFAQSSHLKTHIITHTGEKPYACKVCSYKCSRSNYLKIHMRTHTRKK